MTDVLQDDSTDLGLQHDGRARRDMGKPVLDLSENRLIGAADQGRLFTQLCLLT